MIRELKFEDFPQLGSWLRSKEQRDVIGITEQEAMNADMKHWNAVFTILTQSNCSFVSIDANGRLDGAALGTAIPLIWSPNRIDMTLLAVQGNNRITTAKLFKTWMDRASSMSNVNRILVDKIDGTNFNYEKLGFTKLRETYEKEI